MQDQRGDNHPDAKHGVGNIEHHPGFVFIEGRNDGHDGDHHRANAQTNHQIETKEQRHGIGKAGAHQADNHQQRADQHHDFQTFFVGQVAGQQAGNQKANLKQGN